MLEARAFEAYSLSDVIRDELAKAGFEETRERMIQTGRRLREEHGVAVLADRLSDRFSGSSHYVIDSIRHPAEVEALRRRNERFALLWVDAPLPLRFGRLRQRGRSGDPESEAALRVFEARERGGEGAAGQQLDAVAKLADYRLSNDGDLDALEHQVDALLASFGVT